MTIAPVLWVIVAVAVIAAVNHGSARPAEGDDVEGAIRDQLPAELPPVDSTGWPQHAFTMAITWYRVGEPELAADMANDLWALRDEETGLWSNSAGDIDAANPFFATLLFVLVGQHDRATSISERAIEHAREIWNGGAYNEPWLAAMSAPLVGERPPSDLTAKAQDGLYGAYSSREGVTPKGRYYADIMRAYWCATGGPCWELLADETEYCPSLGVGQRECESFYAWANGTPRFPDLEGEPYSFWTDGILYYALPGTGLTIRKREMPHQHQVPGIARER